MVNFQDYPVTNQLRTVLNKLLNAPAPLVGELNHYFNADKCGIGWCERFGACSNRAFPFLRSGPTSNLPAPPLVPCAEGDSERILVAGARLGPGADGLPLKYQWPLQGQPIGAEGLVKLNAGDIYIASMKAVGTDWKRRKVPTLRHAAGKGARTLVAKSARLARRRRTLWPWRRLLPSRRTGVLQTLCCLLVLFAVYVFKYCLLFMLIMLLLA